MELTPSSIEVKFCLNDCEGLLSTLVIDTFFGKSRVLSEYLWRPTYNKRYWLCSEQKLSFVKTFVKVLPECVWRCTYIIRYYTRCHGRWHRWRQHRHRRRRKRQLLLNRPLYTIVFFMKKCTIVRRIFSCKIHFSYYERFRSNSRFRIGDRQRQYFFQVLSECMWRSTCNIWHWRHLQQHLSFVNMFV